MIAADGTLQALVRIAAPIVWRNQQKIAAKLEGFAATEAGSALDMLKAAELTSDPLLRRLFFKHAMDEARHAEMFRAAARRIDPRPAHTMSEYALIHARRQNLYQNLGPLRFLAFVHLAERRGEAHFRALSKHFSARGEQEIATLFERIARDERFHVRYSRKMLEREAARSGKRSAVHWLRRSELDRAFAGWRRSGRQIGDLIARSMLVLIYVFCLAPFALAQALLEPKQKGWRKPKRGGDLRRQF